MIPRISKRLLLRNYKSMTQDSIGHIYLKHDPSYSFTKINDHSLSIFPNSPRTSLKLFLNAEQPHFMLSRERERGGVGVVTRELMIQIYQDPIRIDEAISSDLIHDESNVFPIFSTVYSIVSNDVQYRL